MTVGLDGQDSIPLLSDIAQATGDILEVQVPDGLPDMEPKGPEFPVGVIKYPDEGQQLVESLGW